MTRVARAALLGLALTVAATACGPAGAGPGGASTQSTTSTQSAPQGQEIAPSSLILASKLIPAPSDLNPKEGDQILEVQVPPRLTGPEEAAAEWQATVDAVAAAQGTSVVGMGMTTSGDFADGAATLALQGDAPFGQSSSAEVQSKILAGAKVLGLTVTNMDVHTTSAGQSAVVTATVDGDLASFVRSHHSPSAEMNADAAVFVQILDDTGGLAVAEGSVPNALSVGWIDPSLHAGCVSIACS